MFAVVAPIIFVLLWSTGWVVAKIAAPHADPLTFLTVRYVASFALLAPAAFALGARWPKGRAAWGAALANGMLLHGVYLGGVWWAIAHGVPAGVSALIAALQPIFTVLAAGPLVGERLGLRRAGGVALGFLGVSAVVAPKLIAGVGDFSGLAGPIAINVSAMLAITAATLHQKRALKGADIRTLAPIQYLGAIIVTVPVALATESLRFEPTPETFAALAWSVVGLSIGGVALMLALIARGEVSRVSALIFLVPPIAALQAYFLFGETLTVVQLCGMAVAAAGVLLANDRRPPALAEGCIAAEPADDEDRGELFRRPA